MGLLNPLFLLAAAAVAVPLYLHLARRSTARRKPFPALRYLRRTERDHASRIRLQQLLLLAFRCAVLLLLVLAGARLYLSGSGEDHEPTAVAIVLDNSLSSSVVVEGERLLDDLKRRALETVERAGPADRIWLMRAAEPWEVSRSIDPPTLRDRIEETEPTAAAASLPEALAEARSLVAAAELVGAEVHLLTDGQATGMDESGSVPDGEASSTARPTVLVYAPDTAPPGNRWIEGVDVGGGLPPLVNQATELGIRVEAEPSPDNPSSGAAPSEADGGDGQGIRARVVLDQRVVAAVDADPGNVVTVPLGPFGSEWIGGFVELDSDALRTDDRRHFTFRVRPPPRVRVTGDPGRFVREAVGVLREAERVREAPPGEADLHLATEAQGLTASDGAAAVILPPRDPAFLPATNRRLRDAGIPWRLAVDPGEGETRLRSESFPLSLDSVVVRRAYLLEPVGEEAERSGIRIRRSSGEPWLVSQGEGPLPYLLLASPLDPEATTLPVRTEMLPLMEWFLTGWFRGAPVSAETTAGRPFSLPEDAIEVVAPDGTRHPVDGTDAFERTGASGIYEVRGGDSLVARIAVVPDPRESRLARLDRGAYTERLGGPLRATAEPERWVDEIFRERRGREVWKTLLGAALLLLFAEGLIAPAGETRPSDTRLSNRRRPATSP